MFVPSRGEKPKKILGFIQTSVGETLMYEIGKNLRIKVPNTGVFAILQSLEFLSSENTPVVPCSPYLLKIRLRTLQRFCGFLHQKSSIRTKMAGRFMFCILHSSAWT